MKSKHLSESEFQLFITDRANLNQELLTHITGCSVCQANLRAYEVLFSDVKNLTRPQFDFDLSEAVLKGIPVVKPAFPWGIVLFVCLAISFTAIYLTAFSSYLIHVFKVLPPELFIMITLAAILVLLFQGIEVIKTHQRKINSINQ
jgi:hypothetical protein